jgi:hypothetical protein
VGGFAVAHAGFPRTTDDLDLLLEPSEPNLRAMIQVLSAFGEGHAAELSPADFPMEEGCVRVRESFDVDLFTQMSGHTYADLLPQSTERTVEGQRVRFLGAEGLIRLKEGSLREKDQLDVLVLRRILGGGKP